MFEAFPLELPADHPYAPKPFFAGPTVTEISVPSGKLIASDDLRQGPFDLEPQQSINYGAGCDAYAKLFSQFNVGYASVGNSCPRITRNSDGLIQVMSPYWSAETGAIFDESEEVVAVICTDHWATMITDYDFWLAMGGKTVEEANKEFNSETFFLIDVTPGKYRWTVYAHADNFDRDVTDRVVFAKLELIEAFKTS